MTYSSLNSDSAPAKRKLPVKKFKLDIKKRKPRPLKKIGSKSNFLIEVGGLPEKYPKTPEMLIYYITRSAILRFIERETSESFLPTGSTHKSTFYRLPYFIDTNSWMVFRSFFSVGITYEITTQNDLSSILSAAWKADNTVREQWGIFHQFYHSFRTTEPEFDISFQMWLNLKYKKPKDYLVVHKEVCDKLFSVFEIPKLLEINESGNYHMRDKIETEGKLYPITDHILESIRSNDNVKVSFEKALRKLENELSNVLCFDEINS